MDWLNNNTMLLTQKALDVSWTKQKTALDNIANVDTPGYKAKYVLFEDNLREKLRHVHGRKPSEIRESIRETGAWIRRSEEESNRLDGNNVNLDVEELEVARNAYQYQFALRQMSDQLARLRLAIEGR